MARVAASAPGTTGLQPERRRTAQTPPPAQPQPPAARCPLIAMTSLTRCYIGLGANLNDPAAQIRTALQALAQLPHTRLLRVSSLYGSKPLGPQDQPDYLNAVAELDTQLEPLALLDALQAQEQQQGKDQTPPLGASVVSTLTCCYTAIPQCAANASTSPHSELKNRSFVVEPLRELNPDLQLPDGTALASLTPAFGGELVRIAPLSRPEG